MRGVGEGQRLVALLFSGGEREVGVQSFFMRRAALLAGVGVFVVAGACGVALADDSDAIDFSAPGAPVGIEYVTPPQPFTGRRVVTIYSTAIGNGGDWRGSQCTTAFTERTFGDDFNVSVPAYATFPIRATGSIWMTFRLLGLGDPDDPNYNNVTIRQTFYDTFTGWVGGTFPGTSQFGVVVRDIVSGMGGGGSEFPPGTPPIFLNDAAGFATTTYLAYQSDMLSPNFTGYSRGANTSIVSPGTSNPQRWLDCDNNGIVGAVGTFTGAGGLEVNAAGVVPNQRAMYFSIQADVPCSPEPVATVVGSLPDGTTSRMGTATIAGAVWYDITIAGDANDAGRRFLDIDTEGSAANVAVGIYDANSAGNCAQVAGNVGQHFDDDSGSGTNAQLTFGVGRRAAVGTGTQYDGRDGELLAGRYLVAIAPSGSTFASEYVVGTSPSNTNVGPFTIRFTTNTVGGSLAPSTVPTLITGGDAGCLGMQASPIHGAAFITQPYEIGWYRFVVSDIPQNGPAYLDIDFARCAPLADAEAGVFNAGGNAVFASDDWVDAAIPTYDNPGFSFGDSASPRGPYYAGGASTYQGQDGGLAAGEYYVGVGLFNVSALALHDRWHLRSNSGAGFSIAPTFSFAGLSSCGAACDSIDFNNDGVTPDSLDITDYLSVFGGGVCSNDPQCGDLDFNNDSVSPDSGDIDAIIRVFGGGAC